MANKLFPITAKFNHFSESVKLFQNLPIESFLLEIKSKRIVDTRDISRRKAVLFNSALLAISLIIIISIHARSLSLVPARASRVFSQLFIIFNVEFKSTTLSIFLFGLIFCTILNAFETFNLNSLMFLYLGMNKRVRARTSKY